MSTTEIAKAEKRFKKTRQRHTFQKQHNSKEEHRNTTKAKTHTLQTPRE